MPKHYVNLQLTFHCDYAVCVEADSAEQAESVARELAKAQRGSVSQSENLELHDIDADWDCEADDSAELSSAA